MADNLDVRFVNPFILGAADVFKTMAGLEVKRTGLRLKDKSENCFGDISGVIGFAGDLTGNFAVSLPEKLALTLIGNMIGEEPDIEDKIFNEGVSELANMVVGSAKSKIATDTGWKFQLSIPSVIIGKGHFVSHPSSMKVILFEFEVTGIDRFTIELCIKEDRD